MTQLTRIVKNGSTTTKETFTSEYLTQLGHYRVGSKSVEEHWMNPTTCEIITYKVVCPEYKGLHIGDHVTEGIPNEDTDIGVIIGFDLPNNVAIVKYEWWNFGKQISYVDIDLEDLVIIS